MLSKFSVQVTLIAVFVTILVHHVSIILLHHVLFLLTMYVESRVNTFKPRVLKDQCSRGPLFRVYLEHGLDQMNDLARNLLMAVLNLLLIKFWFKIVKLVSGQRHVSVQHTIQADTCGPYVDLEAFVAIFIHDLRSDIGRSATLLVECLFRLDAPANAEVTDLDVTVAVQQDVVKFEVAVHDPLPVHVEDAEHNLLENELYLSLFEPAALLDILEKISAWTKLHDYQVVFDRLKRFEQPYVV